MKTLIRILLSTFLLLAVHLARSLALLPVNPGRMTSVALRNAGSDFASNKPQKGEMSAGPSSSKIPEREVLAKILASDVELVNLSDIRSIRAWDFSWPTLTVEHRFTERYTFTSDEPMLSAISAHNYGVTQALLKQVGAFDSNNSIVLHGGALVDLVLKRGDSIKDWDLRLIGSDYVGNEEKCVEAARDFVKSVFDWIKSENERLQIQNCKRQEDGNKEEALFDMNAVQVSRWYSTITVIVPSRGKVERTILQFTFAPMTSIKELFRHSKPHCTSIALYQGKIVLDNSARYCLESLCVVLDPATLTHCQVDENGPDNAPDLTREIQRMITYFKEKGFDIILPGLDIDNLPTRNLKFDLMEALDLPALTAIYRKVEGNKIMVNTGLRIPGSNLSASIVDYSDQSSINAGTAIHHNIRCLVGDIYDRFQYVIEGEQVEPIFSFTPTLMPRSIDKSYETVRRDTLCDSSLDVGMVNSYFSRDTARDGD